MARVQRQAPRIPYVSNLTGTWVTAAEAVDPGYWSQHLRQTVRFGQGLKELLSDPERALLEVGPGRTLSGLAGRLAGRKAKNPVLSSMRHPNESQSDVAFLLGALGRLWLAGAEVDWRAFHGPAPRWGPDTYPGLGLYGLAQYVIPGMSAVRVTSRFAVVFLVFLLLMRSPTQSSVGALLVPFGALCALVGMAWGSGETAVLPLFRTPLFAVHTLAAFLGYSALSVACCAGILYLVLHDQLSHKRIGRLFHRLPPLEDLDQLAHRTVWLGFVLLTLAIAAGALWARQEWGVAWIWEPKGVWAIVSWVVYAGYLVARRSGGWRGERAAWLATVGFAVSIAGFLGTNYFLAAGRHAF